MTGQEFVEKYNVSIVFEQIDERGDDLWDGSNGAQHFRVKLQSLNQLREVEVIFSIGSALTTDDVTRLAVLESMALDASGVENCGDMANFLEEFGYVENALSIRTGMKVYKGCEESRSKLQKLFGQEGYEEILNVEWD